MNYKNLHTHTLEQLFGPISLHILKQNETIRIVELKDSDGLSRTLAIVRFLDIHGKRLKEAYDKIMSGELLGKTLCDFKIDFDKKYTGSVELKLPEWLKNDFKTDNDLGIAFISNIWVKDSSLEPQKFIFSEIIEIIPEDLKSDFKYKINPLEKIDSQVKSLFEEANINLINV
jgi:hypothetical protein